MLPADADWFANDGNEPITFGWTNAIERSVDFDSAGDSEKVFPAPTGTTLPGGGGKIRLFSHDPAGAGLATATRDIIDGDFDYRNRLLYVLVFAARNIGGKAEIPGGGGEPTTQPMGNDLAWTAGKTWGYMERSGATAGTPPANCNYIEISPNVYLFVADDNSLSILNNAGATYWFWLWYMVSDQYPTRP